MKILITCPTFGKDLLGGAEYYNYMIATGLVNCNHDVTVATTTSKKFIPRGNFALEWPDDYSAGLTRTDGVEIRRFSAYSRLPAWLGRATSLFIMRRWAEEEKKLGTSLKGSRHFLDYCYKRAMGRPKIYDDLFLLGLGPHSESMRVYIKQAINNFDLVIAAFLPFALPIWVSRVVRRYNKPVALLPLFHPDDIYHHHRPFYRLFGEVDAVMTLTEYSAQTISKINAQARPHVVGAGVEVAAFSNSNISGQRFRQKYGLESKFVVLCVGRKEYHKRYDWAVQAINQLADDDIRLVMIGADIDGQPIESPYVRFLGKLSREDLLDAYDACNVLLHPSEHESFGMVFLEAWMRRKPVIGNARCGPVSSLITPGIDGFLAWNVEEIAQLIQRLRENPALSQALGQAGYNKANDRYTWVHVVNKVHALCVKLADKHTVPTR